MINPVEIVQCPFCSSKSVELEERDLKSRGKILKWWFYVCKKCKETFTTTESDEISLNQK